MPNDRPIGLLGTNGMSSILRVGVEWPLLYQIYLVRDLSKRCGVVPVGECAGRFRGGFEVVCVHRRSGLCRP